MSKSNQRPFNQSEMVFPEPEHSQLVTSSCVAVSQSPGGDVMMEDAPAFDAAGMPDGPVMSY